ncbi:MAG: VWA domain-containing protein [Acidobacteriota bacterium]
MARRYRRRRLDPIGLSFLDAMTCGFGAVVLFYMIIQGAVEEKVERVTVDRRAEVDRLEEEVLEGVESLVEARNTLEEMERRRVVTAGLSRRLIETLEEIQRQLATAENETLASREDLNRLQTDLQTLERDSKRLAASLPSDETPGDRVRAFVGDGDRQYLTGLKIGGKRNLILIDSSASMLADTVVNVLVRRNLPVAQKRRAAKWRRAVATVDWMTAQLPPDSFVQVYSYAEQADAALPETRGRWLASSDREVLDRAVAALRGRAPAGGTNLERAFEAIATLDPPPDNLLLLVDGLPTQGSRPSRRAKVTGRARAKLFDRAVGKLPRELPVNVVLFPMEGDPAAPAAYWKLALASGGSFLSPPEDWP